MAVAPNLAINGKDIAFSKKAAANSYWQQARQGAKSRNADCELQVLPLLGLREPILLVLHYGHKFSL